jgi:hypothetical protein
MISSIKKKVTYENQTKKKVWKKIFFFRSHTEYQEIFFLQREERSIQAKEKTPELKNAQSICW